MASKIICDANASVTESAAHTVLYKVKVKVMSICNNAYSQTPPKCSDMARVIKGSHGFTFTCTSRVHTYSVSQKRPITLVNVG